MKMAEEILIESGGIVIPLGRWKCRMCLKIASWRAKGPVGDSPKRSAIMTYSTIWTPTLARGPVKLSEGGKGKGKKPITEVPKHNFDNDGESFDSQAAFSELDDDQPLQLRRTEIRGRSRPNSSRAPTATPAIADTVLAPAPTMAPVPPAQVFSSPTTQQIKSRRTEDDGR
uniref:Uncharacterized protein n=1 Tax=Solanum tuberosum TaxID=4113 RepID=M1DWM9_SOLTU